MATEKEEMLNAVQYALAEYEDTGAVSVRTVEVLEARCILLRHEIEQEMLDEVERINANLNQMELQLTGDPE